MEKPGRRDDFERGVPGSSARPEVRWPEERTGSAAPTAPRFDPRGITRPDPALLQYYFWVSLATVFAFPFVFLPLYFKYRTLEYRFDDDGVSMAWGRFYRREIHLTYRRIQDIHVTRNLLQRWLGLGSLSLQTASGSAGAEMTIEGIRRPELLRDFLYGRMRGVREEDRQGETGGGAEVTDGMDPTLAVEREDEALRLLRDIRDALRRRTGP